MKFDYQLTESDILSHQLYVLSQSISFQKRRNRGRIFLLLIYLVTGAYIWKRNGTVTAAVFYLVCLPFYFIYKRMEARQYEKHIANYVKEQYKDSLQTVFSLSWDEDKIVSSNGSNQHEVAWIELESVTETKSLIMLNFRNNHTIILPKEGLAQRNEIKDYLLSKTDALGVPYQEYEDWKWK